MPFVKLDTSILTSTLWMDRDAREVFITALLMAEPRELVEPTPEIAVRSLDHTGFVVPPGWYGFAQAAGVGIVHAAGLEREAGLAALERLTSPEPDSRSPKWEGRRMVRVDGGFVILNYIEYRDRDHTAAERQRRWRERQRQKRASAHDGDDDDTPPTDETPPDNAVESHNDVALRYDDVTSRKQKQKQKQSLTTTTSNEVAAVAANPSQTGWKGEAADALRRAGVPEAEIGDAIKNWWAHARKRFTDGEIVEVVIAQGRKMREPWNPARVWNPHNEKFDERFRYAISKVREQAARSGPSRGLAAIGEVMSKLQQPQ